MTKYEQNWCQHFVTECYFDTVLAKSLLQTQKRLIHKQGCSNVINELNSKRLREDFAVALIDKDKFELTYLKNCKVIYNENKLLLWKHVERMHFVIQLNPPLEKWIIEVLNENDLNIESFGYSVSYKKLKAQIKNDIDTENDEKLNLLVNAIIKTDCASIKKIKSFLLYLKEKNYQADINTLING